MKLSTVLWIFVWSIFMGVTAISIGFGALFPSMNRIAKPFVCPRGEMEYESQVYRPYPGKTVTTLTWYCADRETGARTELGIFPMSLYAGAIYGFLLFVVIVVAMWMFAGRLPASTGQRRASRLDFNQNVGTTGDAASRLRELNRLRDTGLITEEEYQKKRAEIILEL